MTDAELQEKLETPLADIGLSVRTVNGLERDGLLFVGQLLQRTPGSLRSIKNFGPKVMDEIFGCLAAIGLHRREPAPAPRDLASAIASAPERRSA